MSGAKGFPVVLSAPSGGGKDTIAAALLGTLPWLQKSRSLTTRAPRAGEQDGREYDFVTAEEFARRRAAGSFVECAEVHGHWYGTDKAFVAAACAEGRSPLLVIDVQGGLAIRAVDPSAVLLFLMPRSLDELEARLRGRGTDAPEALAVRLGNARREIAESLAYDYHVVNAHLDVAVAQAADLLRRLRRSS